MRPLISLVVVMLATPGMAATPLLAEAVVSIKGMACEMCSKRIVEVLEKRPDIDAVEINFKGGLALVRYEAAALDAPGLQVAVERLGFDVDGVTALPRDRLLVLSLRAPAWAGTVDVNAELARQVAAASPGFDLVEGDALRRVRRSEAEVEAHVCEDGPCAVRLGRAAGARYVIFGRAHREEADQVLRVDLYDCATGSVVAQVTIKNVDVGGSAERVRQGLGQLVAGALDARRSRALNVDDRLGPPRPAALPDGRAPSDRQLADER